MTATFAQDLLAGLAALAALIYLVRRRVRHRGAACEGCPAGVCEPPAVRQDAPRARETLVTIEGSHEPRAGG